MLRRLKRTKRPLVLTVNGKAALVVNDPSTYEQLLARIEFEETAAGIAEGLADVEAGRVTDLDEFLEKLRAPARR